MIDVRSMPSIGALSPQAHGSSNGGYGGNGFGQDTTQIQITPAIRAFIGANGNLAVAAEALSTPERKYEEVDLALELMRDKNSLDAAIRAITLVQLYETTSFLGKTLQLKITDLKPDEMAKAYASFLAMIEKLTDRRTGFIANQTNLSMEGNINTLVQSVPDPTIRAALGMLLHNPDARIDLSKPIEKATEDGQYTWNTDEPQNNTPDGIADTEDTENNTKSLFEMDGETNIQFYDDNVGEDNLPSAPMPGGSQ